MGPGRDAAVSPGNCSGGPGARAAETGGRREPERPRDVVEAELPRAEERGGAAPDGRLEAAAALLDHLSASQCPEVQVQPVICFVNNPSADQISNIGGVRICTDESLYQLFENTLTTPPESGALALIASELKHCVEEK